MKLATALILVFAMPAFAQPPSASTASQPADPAQQEQKGAQPASVPAAANDVSVPGTVADALLAADITKMIKLLDSADHPHCKFKVLQQFHAAGKPGVERWEVRSCDAITSYDVQIVPSPRGGSDFRATKSVPVQEKKEPEKTTQPAASAPVTSQPATAGASSPEFVPYEDQKSEFTIAIPKEWVGQDQSQTMGQRDLKFNLILFHSSYPLSAPDKKSAEEMAIKYLTGIDSGEIPSFFIQRLPAKNGMSCAGFSEKAEKDLFKIISNDPILNKRATILEAARSEPATVAGCKGVRIHGSGQPAKENVAQTVDIYAASDGTVLYLFTLRNHADFYKKNVEIFQKSVATARLTAAK